MSPTISWQNCRACSRWHPIGAPHLPVKEQRRAARERTHWYAGKPYVDSARCTGGSGSQDFLQTLEAAEIEMGDRRTQQPPQKEEDPTR